MMNSGERRDICARYGIDAEDARHLIEGLRIEESELSIALLFASDESYLAPLEEFVAGSGEEALSRDGGMGSNALMWACYSALTLEKLKLLERYHAAWVEEHISAVDDEGWTALHYLSLSRSDDWRSLIFLVNHGIDIDARTYEHGWTALHSFARWYRRYEDCIRHLLGFGPKVFEDSYGEVPSVLEWKHSYRGTLIREYEKGKEVYPYEPATEAQRGSR
jgi:hypothetical protein